MLPIEGTAMTPLVAPSMQWCLRRTWFGTQGIQAAGLNRFFLDARLDASHPAILGVATTAPTAFDEGVKKLVLSRADFGSRP